MIFLLSLYTFLDTRRGVGDSEVNDSRHRPSVVALRLTLPLISRCVPPVGLCVEDRLWHESAFSCARQPAALEHDVRIGQEPSPHWAADNSHVKSTVQAVSSRQQQQQQQQPLKILSSYSQRKQILELLQPRCHLAAFSERLCGLVVRVPGYITEMYCDSCEVRTEFMYVM
jgi:hypothetical protein